MLGAQQGSTAPCRVNGRPFVPIRSGPSAVTRGQGGRLVLVAPRAAASSSGDPPPGPGGAFTPGQEAATRQTLFNRIAPVYDEVCAWGGRGGVVGLAPLSPHYHPRALSVAAAGGGITKLCMHACGFGRTSMHADEPCKHAWMGQ